MKGPHLQTFLLATLLICCLNYQANAQNKYKPLSFTDLLSFKQKDSASIVAVLITHGFRKNSNNIDDEKGKLLNYQMPGLYGSKFIGALEKGKLNTFDYGFMNDTTAAIMMTDIKKAGFVETYKEADGFHAGFKKGDISVYVSEKSYASFPKPVQTFTVFFYTPKMPKPQ